MTDVKLNLLIRSVFFCVVGHSVTSQNATKLVTHHQHNYTETSITYTDIN